MEITIEKIIEDYYHSNPKDGGNSFISNLAIEINSLERNEIMEYVNVFINNLTSKNEKNWILSLHTLVRINKFPVAPYIYKTLIDNFEERSCEWKDEFVQALLILKYSEANDFYQKYFNDLIEVKENSGGLYYKLILYTNVDPQNALEMLADYLCRIDAEGELKICDGQLGYLIFNFSELGIETLYKLVSNIEKINKNISIRFINMLIDHLRLNRAGNYDKHFKYQVVNSLKNLLLKS